MPEQQKLSLEGITMPKMEGAAPAAVEHFIDNLPFSGLADNPFALERVINRGNAAERRLSHFLRWVNKIYAPKKVLYPFSGWHTTPRDILGDDRVIHLSNETDNDGNPRQFLRDLEYGLRVEGDARNQPFSDQVFDAVFLRIGESIVDLELEDLEGGEGLNKVFSECRRVVKPRGLFIVESSGQQSLVDLCKQTLEHEKLPGAVNELLRKSYWVFRNENKYPTDNFWEKSAKNAGRFVNFMQYKT
jgi:SAM-dependent methyltransferase